MKLDINPFPALAPVPVVLATVGDINKSNIITIAWCGIVNSDKPMVYVSIRPERYSFDIIKKGKEFVINFVDKKLCRKMDIIGAKSGRTIDKFNELNLTKGESKIVKTPYIEESPVNIECKVIKEISLGTHVMFIGEIVNVKIDDNLKDKKGRICFDKLKLITHVHSDYFELGKKVNSRGYAVRKISKSNSKNKKVK